MDIPKVPGGRGFESLPSPKIVRQGTGGHIGINQDAAFSELIGENRRHELTFDEANLGGDFDCC